jgi:hypothetical protein
MVKQPGLFSPEFGVTSSHVFTQSLQNVAVEPWIHSLACWDRCFVLPQLLYRWRHHSGIFWIPPCVIGEFSVEPMHVSIRSTLILSSHTRIISFQFSLPHRCCIKNCAFVPSPSFVPQDAPKSLLDAINCSQYPYFLDVTPRHWVIVYRHFRINLHTSSWSGILFNIWTIGHETTRLYRNVEYRLPSDTTVMHSNWWTEREGLIVGKQEL